MGRLATNIDPGTWPTGPPAHIWHAGERLLAFLTPESESRDVRLKGEFA
jgi:hypothetical protein